MATIMKNTRISWYKKWWANPWFHLLVFVIGSLLVIKAHVDSLLSKGIMSQFAARPSQVVHDFVIFPLAFYGVISVIPVLFQQDVLPQWAKRTAQAMLVLYTCLWIYDLFNISDPFKLFGW
jgi:hypothetical protein